MKRWLVKGTSGFMVAAIVAATAGFPRKAEAGVPLPFATEVTQLLNHVELINQDIQQVQMVANQIQQYQNMLTHTLNFPNQLFGPVMNDLVQLGSIVQKGQAIAYSMGNLDGIFTQRFPGYRLVSRNYGQQYKSWGQTALDSTRGALDAAGLQSSQLQSEQAVLNGLRSMSETSQGRMQAIQAGNQISEQQVEQLMKLREIMLADLQSKAAYQSSQVQQQLTNQANSDAFFAPARITSDGVPF
jgi:type IV secretion system protein TrbJ